MEVAIIKNSQELERLEGIITHTLQSFYESGRALMEIRDKLYYRDVLGHETFEGYLKKRWGIQRAHGYRLMESAKVYDNVSPIGDIKPTAETQIRPLYRLEPVQQREAWQQAIKIASDSKVTAAHVSKVVRGMVGKKEGQKGPDEKAGDRKNPVGKIEESTVLFGLMRLWKEAGEEDKNKFRLWIDGESAPATTEMFKVA
jgi:hypothetical protein